MWQASHRHQFISYYYWLVNLLLFSRSVVSDSLWAHGLQMPGFPVLHCLLEFAQTHVYWVDDIHPSHPLSPPSPFALNFSQEQSLFQMSLFFHIKWSKDWNFLHKTYSVQFSSVQWLSRVQLFATPWITACQASLIITKSRSSLRLTSIKSVMPSSHLILCHPLLLLSPILPSIRVFSNESSLFQWVNSLHEVAVYYLTIIYHLYCSLLCPKENVL